MGRVFVAGSIIMDVVATAPRHPQIGETVLGHGMFFFPGGKGANQAVAAARLGASTSLIGRIGRDAFGGELKTFLSAQDIDLGCVLDTDGAPTGSAVIVVAENDNAIVVVPAANAELSVSDVERADLARGDVLLAQLEIPLPTITAFFARGRAIGARTILNPAPAVAFDRALFALADLVILNETELAASTLRAVNATTPPAELAAAARALADRCRTGHLRHHRQPRRRRPGRRRDALLRGQARHDRRHDRRRRLLRGRGRRRTRARPAAL